VQEKTALILAKDAKVNVRTSSLAAPTMLLSGHGGPVYTCKFNPAGSYIASGSQDKLILLWKVYGDCANWGTLKGHTNSVLDVCWSRDGDQLFSASADKTAAVWDVEQAQRVRRMRDHTSFVNSICAARKGDPLVVTGSDDCKALIWDVRVKAAQQTFEAEYQVLAVGFSDDSLRVFLGGIDHEIKVWDRRTNKILYGLEGHTDAVTAVRLSPDGTHLLSNGMDNTLRLWDVRPFVSSATSTRLVHTFEGARHDLQKNLLKCSWSKDGTRVSCGSADRLVNVWDSTSKRLLYRLPGHGGCVNEVDFHPTEPIIVSGAEDKKMFLGEIQPSFNF